MYMYFTFESDLIESSKNFASRCKTKHSKLSYTAEIDASLLHVKGELQRRKIMFAAFSDTEYDVNKKSF